MGSNTSLDYKKSTEEIEEMALLNNMRVFSLPKL